MPMSSVWERKPDQILRGRAGVSGDLFGIVQMGEHDGAFFDDEQLPGETRRVLGAGLGGELFQILDQQAFVFGGDGVDRVGAVLILRRRFNEHAALKAGLVKPFAEHIEHGAELIFRVTGQRLNPAHHPIAELLVAQTQGRQDQLFLGAEMFVNRGLGDTGLFGQPVHADGVKAAGVKRLQGLLHQLIAFRCTQFMSLQGL